MTTVLSGALSPCVECFSVKSALRKPFKSMIHVEIVQFLTLYPTWFQT